MTAVGPSRLLGLIVPCHNVARYLPDFLESLTRQDLGRVELIFVDDGSTDDTGTLVKEWLAERPAVAGRMISQQNAGLAAARNAGLAVATTPWVSFPDPDDVLGAGYLAELTGFLDSARSDPVALVCARVLILDEATGEITDSHPLRHRFDDRDPVTVVSARQRPDRIHLQAASACYRLDRLRAAGLEFDGRVRPNYEDGQLTARYLWLEEEPRIAFLRGAEYRYRRRADGSSLVQTGRRHPGRYTDVIEHGYLAVARELAGRHGTVPRWAQRQILYDLFFSFREDERPHAATARLDAAVTERFHALVGELRRYLDEAEIDAYRLTWTPDRMRQALRYGYRAEPYRPEEVRIQRIDAERRMGLLRYYYTGPEPAEEIRYRGRPIRPRYAKHRAVEYLGRALLTERMAWLPVEGDLEIDLDGRPVRLAPGPPERAPYRLEPDQVWRRLAKSAPPTVPPAAPTGAAPAAETGRGGLEQPERGVPRPIRVAGRLARRALRLARRTPSRATTEPAAEPTPGELKRLARSEPARARYGDAWLFQDRDSQAQDNAEHLYRYVRRAAPEINAWFVLRGDSPDWARLAAEGFRLIDHGSAEHSIALLNCRHLLSSQADHYVTRPLDVAVFGKPRWRFTFLQHGVMQTDLSRWLNSKPIQTFVTSAVPEHAAITGDGTGWNFTGKEVRLTGLARHDALLAEAAAADPDDGCLVIMPTWRRWLLGPDTGSGNDRPPVEDFWGTEYARRWTELITAPGLAEIADRTGHPIVFVPHPNLRHCFADAPWPERIRVHDHAAGGLHRVLARAALLITDYSSVAADAGYLLRPVVHYQFDAAEFYGGGHLGRTGSRVPEALRFGPVFPSATEVVEHVGVVADRGFAVEPGYADRMRAAFPYRDGRCCERIVAAVRADRRPAAEDEIFTEIRDEPM